MEQMMRMMGFQVYLMTDLVHDALKEEQGCFFDHDEAQFLSMVFVQIFYH